MSRFASFTRVEEFERAGGDLVSKMAWDYCQSGTDDMVTVRDNRDVFRRMYLQPAAAPSLATSGGSGQEVSLSTTLLGAHVSAPIGVSPSAYHRLYHSDGEVATARACRSARVCFTHSLFSSVSMEDVTAALASDGDPRDGLRWLQLYVLPDWSITQRQIRCAESCGYRALVVTCDLPVCSVRRANVREPFTLPAHIGTPNLEPFLGKLTTFYDPRWDMSRLTWDHIRAMKDFTDLPIVLKGVITVEDAVRAHEVGVSAVWVSNHGGRALDSTVPAPLAVRGIRRALDDLGESGRRVEVYVDGGVRSGADVYKCLCMGARAVFVGRPALWALSCGGKPALEHMMGILREELENTVRLQGDAGNGRVTVELQHQELSKL